MCLFYLKYCESTQGVNMPVNTRQRGGLTGSYICGNIGPEESLRGHKMKLRTCKDIFKVDVDAIVNPVNCEGIMGGGLALKFKNKYDSNYHAYRLECSNGNLRPGKVFIFKQLGVSPKYIVNFPTKDKVWLPSKYEYITIGLEDLVRQVEELGIKSIAIPALGCGLGGLRWELVYQQIIDAFVTMEDIQVLVSPPWGYT